ncbi:MAG: ribonuclease HII [Oscillospiraceae bacterium]|jgi:ribonuclease HII|nr:ribonuclease HII [Oscillospiraceae bacterium]
MSLFSHDAAVREEESVDLLCGVDEAGRGPLAGPVFAAAVILPRDTVMEGLADSKKLSPKKREALYAEIMERAAAWCIASATVAEIERLNILGASMLAMRRAIGGLALRPELILVDGNSSPGSGCPERCVVGGDDTSASVAAASILAKVERDLYMLELSKRYPEYEFYKHKGYGTRLHYSRLDEYGPCPAHRDAFLRKWRMKKV